MENFIMTRTEMSKLLLSITDQGGSTPQQLLQKIWGRRHRIDKEDNQDVPSFSPEAAPPVLRKFARPECPAAKGLSLREIAALGGMIEYSSVSATAMQNWVKRDFKEYFGSPKLGRKYSLNQAAMLFMIDDLKSALDFESIRALFRQMFLAPDNEDDDLLEPARLYHAYSSLFDEIHGTQPAFGQAEAAGALDGEGGGEALEAAERSASELDHLNGSQRETVRNMLLISTVAVQTCYFQGLARRYADAALQ